MGREAHRRELGIARNTVKRYVRGSDAALAQVRPEGRVLDETRVAVRWPCSTPSPRATPSWCTASWRERAPRRARTVQRVVADRRREKHAAAVATVRYETPPGKQMQIDFGQKKVRVRAVVVVVHMLVANARLLAARVRGGVPGRAHSRVARRDRRCAPSVRWRHTGAAV